MSAWLAQRLNVLLAARTKWGDEEHMHACLFVYLTSIMRICLKRGDVSICGLNHLSKRLHRAATLMKLNGVC